MQSIPPHWETTDDAEQSVPVHIVPTKKQPEQSIPAAKRSSAAIFGIAIIAVAGFLSFGGMDLFPAQVGSTAVQVTITDSGIAPVEILVKGGRRINWLNSSGIPHILSSTTLKDADGKPMETTAIFPGSDISFDIPIDTPDGTYAYVSKTSPDINGSIIVQQDRLPASSSAESLTGYTKPPASSSSAVAASTRPVYTPDYVAASSTSSVTTTTGVSEGPLQQNPYTVGNTTSAVVTKNPSSVAPVMEHRPTKQPESGTGLWIAYFAALIALVIVMKKASV